MAGTELRRPSPARVRQTEAESIYTPPNTPPKTDQISTASTALPESVERGGAPSEEQDLIRIASLQARNKTYTTMPNMTESGLMGMLYLGEQIDALQVKALEVGKQSQCYDEVMLDMIDKFIKFGKLRRLIHEGKKLPRPLWSDIKKIRLAASDILSLDDESGNKNWLVDHDVNDWARFSVMTPTEHLVARLPESRVGGWLCVPARLRPQNRETGVSEYNPRIRQFFDIASEIIFITLTWVFGSVPVMIKSLENPNKKLEVLFYSLFFIFWSIVTSMLTTSFETRLYLNVGMAALYVQNIR
ncbi:hypothetical protein LIA77_04336 [Sarocladium implicatum]|nr:hypothetical protein LIA77_04336 [Sarocladium implicatum]